MTPHEIRNLYLNFFQSKGHEIVRSDTLIPSNDPTLLFTTAGMVQFKALYAGAPLKFATAATCQKCLRAGGKNSDLENVGRTLRHHTFFEMLGNFSFGDYFKKEAISYAIEFLLDVLKMDKSKLWVSVFENDDEAKELWIQSGFPKERIVKLGAKDNFWGPAGSEGACGPCSEIYYDLGADYSCNQPNCSVGCDCERYIEFWNLVFPQFYQEEDGTRKPLTRKGVDTGMGLERISFLMDNNARNNYETLIFKPIIEKIESLTDMKYEYENISSFHVIADHIRALTFAIGDGVIPSNEGRGYVIRRILRRALRFGGKIGLTNSFLYKLVPNVIQEMKLQYPELLQSQAMIEEIIKNEEEKFLSTLYKGISLIEEYIIELKKRNEKTISGEIAFKLYDTYGFPFELILEIALEKNLEVDEQGFKNSMDEQKIKGKSSWKGKSFSIDSIEKLIKNNYPSTLFKGYETQEISAKILGIINSDKLSEKTEESEELILFFDASPFYAESGGQVSDIGVIVSNNGKALVNNVVKSANNIFLHHVKMTEGFFNINDTVTLQINSKRRFEIQKNHSATHILQFVLRKILGAHVKQAGSYVDDQKLRFDFSHTKKISPEELTLIENEVNEIILCNQEVIMTSMSLNEAKNDPIVLANFGDKYEDEVRMISIGSTSKELCGGTHIPMTGLINGFLITSESSVSSGIRRIEAVTGNAFLSLSREKINILEKISELLKTPEYSLYEKIESYTQKIKALEKKLSDIAQSKSTDRAPKIDLSFKEKNCEFIINGFEGLSLQDLLSVQDNLKTKRDKIVILLASIAENQIFYTAFQSGEARIDCNLLMKAVTEISEGKGGGKPFMARGGGKNIQKFEDSLNVAKKFITNCIK